MTNSNIKHLPILQFGNEKLEVLINPLVTWHSDTKQIVWDDCMSFPELAVKVERWQSISLTFQIKTGETKLLEQLSSKDSELIQHEIDHLDGILMSQRMITPVTLENLP
ncbi:MAG: hypothetical protein GY829_01680 [Gammaproteobacteria bacterium]|nr:hypothetical protein [Gammaproteobacteria bacterium]